jgi:LacI family gluconate utilization system Gnt-I transcriptional repressor
MSRSADDTSTRSRDHKGNPSPDSSDRTAADRRGARMSDVARIAGVSAMTVSRALRDPQIVSEETLKRIRSAIDEIGYLPNRVATSLALQRSNIVGQIFPSLRDSLFVDTIQGVADTLGNSFHQMIADSGYTLEGEEAAVEAFLSQQVCGLVLHNTDHTPRVRRLIQESGVPCVETGNLTRDPIDMAVGFSNFDAGYAMTEHLIERGYKRIAFVSLPVKNNERASRRREGYIEALKAHDRAVDKRLIQEAQPGLRSGGQALVRMVESDLGVDAIFLTGDVLAAGAILEAGRRRWKVPDDIAIAGSDDNELQEGLLPPLTSIRFPRYEIGRNAARLLLDRIEMGSSSAAILDLGFKLIQREST